MGAEVQRGFDQSAVMSGVSGIQSNISDLSTQLCNGFAGVSAGFANAETAATARQMANMNQLFGAQTAVTQGINQLGNQLSQCLTKISSNAKKFSTYLNKNTVGTLAA